LLVLVRPVFPCRPLSPFTLVKPRHL
jgi:hypothetical protein